MSQGDALYFNQSETFSEYYEPIAIFIDKIVESNCRLRYFAAFIQTQMRYPIFLDKISKYSNLNNTCPCHVKSKIFV